MSDTIQQISLQTKFAPLFDETILVESGAVYYGGAIGVTACCAFLTKYRLAFCSTGAMGAQIAFGSFGALYGLLASAVASSSKKPRKITFQVLLPEIQCIEKKGFGRKYILNTQSGIKYAVNFNENDRWLNELGKLGIKCSG